MPKEFLDLSESPCFFSWGFPRSGNEKCWSVWQWKDERRNRLILVHAEQAGSGSTSWLIRGRKFRFTIPVLVTKLVFCMMLWVSNDEGGSSLNRMRSANCIWWGELDWRLVLEVFPSWLHFLTEIELELVYSWKQPPWIICFCVRLPKETYVAP